MRAHLPDSVVKVAQCAADMPDPLDHLLDQLGSGPFAAILLFVAPGADLPCIAATARARGGSARILGCTTAGEVGVTGYCDGQILAVALHGDAFEVDVLPLPNLAQLDGEHIISAAIRARQGLTKRASAWAGEFAMLLVDGLSNKEDELTAALAQALGSMPLFGGSAADGRRYLSTHVLHDGVWDRDSGVLALVRTACPIEVFKFEHLRPTDRRMVVTGADSGRRVVTGINGRNAAEEYARLLGISPADITAFTFASHPVLVRLGGNNHVRAIRQRGADGSLSFFSAIEEGIVLTLAEPLDMLAHLRESLEGLAWPVPPEAIIACDCILRRIEAEDRAITDEVSALLAKHRVVGFSTYGEQWHAMHVNQTMTGVAIYPPPLPIPSRRAGHGPA
jgi:hypothetical protein